MRYITIFVPLVAAIGAVSAQTPAPSSTPSQAPLTFDVVSIKPNTSGSGSMSVGMRGDRLNFVNGTAFTVVMNAYSHETFHIYGAPGWMMSERYDITAVSPIGTPTREQYHALMRALLADRFQFKAHTEVRQLPTYRLVRAGADASLGPRLQKTDTDCMAVARDRSGGPPRMSAVTGGPVCGGRGGMGVYAMSGTAMADVARSLSSELGRKVTDETGLEGAYDVLLQWTPENRSAAGTPDEFGSIFTAVQEQLGLKLEPQRSEVEVLVIDHVEHPSEN